MNGFICPVCAQALVRTENSVKCGNNHCFDVAAKGYVNLLLSDMMKTKLPGDNKLMVNARNDFLSKGYYSHLAEGVSSAVNEYNSGSVILDAGCGEGYYTQFIRDNMKTAEFTLLGLDISKFACAKAASRLKGDDRCTIATASIFHMPVSDEMADTIVTMFAPFCRDEFSRVLKKGGILIMAIPGENHLMSLKSAVYDTPYKNETADYEIEGFEFLESRKISREIHIDSHSDIASLFSMTPYYYKTGVEGHERVNALETLDTTAEFEILIYRKQEN